MERENQRIMLTKRLLREALLRLLHKKGLDKINVAELCREAGINRATFYRHYDVPRDVLVEIERELIGRFHDEAKLLRDAAQTRQYIRKICTQMAEYADILRIIILSRSDEDLIGVINALYVERIRTAAREIPLHRSMDEEEIRLLAGYSAGGVYFLLKQWILGNMKKTPQELADFICEMLFSTDWVKVIKELGLTEAT